LEARGRQGLVLLAVLGSLLVLGICHVSCPLLGNSLDLFLYNQLQVLLLGNLLLVVLAEYMVLKLLAAA